MRRRVRLQAKWGPRGVSSVTIKSHAKSFVATGATMVLVLRSVASFQATKVPITSDQSSNHDMFLPMKFLM